MTAPSSPPTDAGWNLDCSYARLPERLYARVAPVPVAAPRVVALNAPLAVELGLDPERLAGPEGAACFSGGALPPGASPIAQAYCGHQFGHFTMLGDGRAHLLGEQIAPDGRRFDIQLKGSGRTPFSRGGDGRAALGPMLREWLVSEGMHALGIPTTRALAVITTGETVMRDRPLPGAILVRVAASHLRVGTFEFAAAAGEPDLSRALVEFALARHPPAGASSSDAAEPGAAEHPALVLLRAVADRQASLVASWLSAGFVHGVMNTDNVAISGETIDYGPCAFLDGYDPAAVFSSIDRRGRYAYGNQAAIAAWNLARLAEALLPLLPDPPERLAETLGGIMRRFHTTLEERRRGAFAKRLGLFTPEAGDGELADEFLALLAHGRADFHRAFRALADGTAPDPHFAEPAPGLERWLARWRARIAREPGAPENLFHRMRGINPAVVPRNHLVERALAAAETGDFLPAERLAAALARPFDGPADHPEFMRPPAPHERVTATFCGT